MIPTFIRFYGYTMTEVLNEYSRTFFALVNSMLELKAGELLDDITVNHADRNTVDDLQKQKRGLRAIVNEVKVVKGIKHG